VPFFRPQGDPATSVGTRLATVGRRRSRSLLASAEGSVVGGHVGLWPPPLHFCPHLEWACRLLSHVGVGGMGGEPFIHPHKMRCRLLRSLVCQRETQGSPREKSTRKVRRVFTAAKLISHLSSCYLCHLRYADR
jgi:hypothetical protein